MPENRKLLWAVLGISAAGAFLAFAYPMYVIRPFRAQGSRELFIALLVKHWAPFLSGLATLIAITCTVLLWRGARSNWARAACGLASLLTIVFAALTHVNVYERMFHRIDSPESMYASEAKLEPDDMVLAIQVEGQAQAYPIRMMGYHHIVNDTIGATPIAATY
jgi:hypothetical protein